MFKLSEAFISQYKGKQPSWGYQDLSYVLYKRSYARQKDDGSQEEFWETTQRVVEGVFNIQLKHCQQMGLPWNAMKAQSSAQKMFGKIWEMKFLPPGRGLWMMGAPIVEKIGSAGLNNCFSGDTEFLTINGSVKLRDACEEIVYVLNRDGEFTQASVKSFGEQKLQRVTLRPFASRSNHRLSYNVTPNHRWILEDGSSTTNLSLGDKIASQISKEVVNNRHYELGKVHGVIFGDGTQHTYYPDRFMIRLCDKKTQELQGIIEDCGHHISTTNVEGDPFVTIRHKNVNFKALPNWQNRFDNADFSPSYIKGFVDGWMAADSHINLGCKHYISYTLDSINSEAIEWLKKNAAIAGYSITGHNVEYSDTNYGPRSQPLQRLSLKQGSLIYVVETIEELESEEVYCVQEPKTNSFTLAGGILTGNCGFISTKDIHKDFSYPFCWAADMLMLGVGIGFDTKGVGKVTINAPTKEEITFIVPDSREGWVDAIRQLLESYAKPGRQTVRFDFSLVRGPGLPIKGFGGTSSGPEPLRQGLESIRQVLDVIVDKPITSVIITDIMNFVGKLVVSGNVRRSAEIAIGDLNDVDFISMKDWRLFPKELEDRRWASNNSVFVKPDDNFEEVVKRIQINGEPGLIFLENARHFGRMKDGYNDSSSSKYDDVDGFNPCAEQGLRHGELCCLVETFPANHENAEEYFETLKYAFLYAKTVTLVPTHSPLTNQVMLQNRRIGLSMSGIQQAIKKFTFGKFFLEFCDHGYEKVRHWDRIYSRWLGIPTSIKVTTVKPSGSVSLLAGATPGVHCTHAPFYFRTIRMSALDPMVQKLLNANYRVELDAKDLKLAPPKLGAGPSALRVTNEALENEIVATSFKQFGEAGGSVVVYFPVKEKNFTKSKFEISLWEQLCLARELQDKWSDNSVSITVTFKPEEAKEIKSAIEYMASYVKTLSFLPLEDHNYAQAPYQACTELEYEDYAQSLKKLRLGSVRGKESGSRYCSNDTCEI